MRRILQGDNLPILRGLEGGIADLIYLDPPFNTGKIQALTASEEIPPMF